MRKRGFNSSALFVGHEVLPQERKNSSASRLWSEAITAGMGPEAQRVVFENAIVNAHYIRARLREHHEDPFNPDSVSLDEASGGFSSVIQMAPQFCLRAFDAHFALPQLKANVLAHDLAAFLAQVPEPFASPHLNSLRARAGSIGDHVLSVRFEAEKLDFVAEPAGQKVCVTYRGYLALDPDEQRLLSRGRVAATMVPSAATRPLRPLVDPLTVLGGTFVGGFTWRICTAWNSAVRAELTQVEVYAELTNAATTVEPHDRDVERILGQFFAAPLLMLLKVPAVHRSRVRLAPVISLVGPNAGPVSEIGDFDVAVFAIASPPSQALVLAFDLAPGCNGIIDAVRHFIGDYDYGLISDEVLLEALLKNKWRHGGFLRTIQLERKVFANYGEDAGEVTVRGTLTFDRLDGEREEAQSAAPGEGWIELA